MKSYVITILNHERSVQVAKRCIRSAAKNGGIEVDFWKATTPTDMPIDKLLDEDVKIAGLHEAYSRIANCAAAFHSHYSLWKHCIELDEEVLIFEHDAYVTDTIKENLSYDKAMSIGKPSYGKWNTPSNIGINPLTSKRYFPGAHAYFVKPAGAKEFIKQAKVMTRSTDIFLNLDWFPWLQEYYPWPVEARDNFTTIQNQTGCLAKHNYGEGYDIEEV